MRKIFYLGCLFLSVLGFSQTYSTGVVQLDVDYTAKIDVNSTTVTLTLVGPSTVWLGLSFDTASPIMGASNANKDVVIFINGTTLSDRKLSGGQSTPTTDTQNWTISSNTVSGSTRTVIATRTRVATEASDYTFPVAAQALSLGWAKGSSSTLAYHASRGATTANLTLGAESFVMDSFKISPNPASEFLTLELPKEVTSGELKIYDQQGKVVVKETVTSQNNIVNLSKLAKGTYITVLRTEFGNAVRNLIVN
ncbi:MAG: T9SS type A sorting domain-containing protein [Limnohabitans sp.]|nr:T9SS type A sorting domain-containing protein [Limnohabitans sp.]